MKKIFYKLAELARLFGAKTKRLPDLVKSRAEQPKERINQKVVLSFKEYLALNMARRFRRRIYYPHSLRKLARLQKRHRRALRLGIAKDPAANEKVLERILMMVKSRASARLRCALPKKQQRKLGLLPAVKPKT